SRVSHLRFAAAAADRPPGAPVPVDHHARPRLPRGRAGRVYDRRQSPRNSGGREHFVEPVFHAIHLKPFYHTPRPGTNALPARRSAYRSGAPVPPLRAHTTSATIASPISCGVSAPMSRPIG